MTSQLSGGKIQQANTPLGLALSHEVPQQLQTHAEYVVASLCKICVRGR